MEFKTVYEESSYALKKLIKSFTEKRTALNNQLNAMTDKQKTQAYKTIAHYDDRIQIMQTALANKAK
jgi:hypothetical protein